MDIKTRLKIKRRYQLVSDNNLWDYMCPYDIHDWIKDFSPIEEATWSAIRYYGLNLWPEYPVGISGNLFFIDFANPEHKMGIEVDGRDYHNQEEDAKRDSLLYRNGWTIIRFSGAEIHKDAYGCMERIYKMYGRLENRPINNVSAHRGYFVKIGDVLNNKNVMEKICKSINIKNMW